MSRRKIIENPVDRFDHDGVKFTDSYIFPDQKSAMNIAVKELEATLAAGKITVSEFYGQLKILRDTYLQQGSELWWKYTEELKDHEREEFDKMMKDETNRLGSMYSIGIISAETYYEKLKALRDTHLKEGTAEWQSMTDKIGEFYTKNVIGAMEKATAAAEKLGGSLFEQMAESTLKSVTVKDKNGKITDRFYRLDDVDPEALKTYTEGYDYLKSLGAGAAILNKYLSTDIKSAGEFIGALKDRGEVSAADYISGLERAKTDSFSFASGAYGVQDFANAVKQAIIELSDSGYFGKSGVEINQTIYADNLSPAETSQELIAALKLQGVGI